MTNHHDGLDDHPTLEADLRALDTEALQGMGPGPDVDELRDYLAGNLPPEAKEALQERLSVDQDAADLLLALADSTRDGTPVDNARVPAWEDLESRLHADGVLGSSPPAIPQPGVDGVHPAWQWAAAALLAISLGLGIEVARHPDGTRPLEPTTDAGHWFLRAVDSTRGGASRTVDAASASWHTLTLVNDNTADFVDFRVEVDRLAPHGPPDVTVWSAAIQPNGDGNFDFNMPAEFLDPGEYSVRLTGVAAAATSSSRITVAEYHMIWETAQAP